MLKQAELIQVGQRFQSPLHFERSVGNSFKAAQRMKAAFRPDRSPHPLGLAGDADAVGLGQTGRRGGKNKDAHNGRTLGTHGMTDKSESRHESLPLPLPIERGAHRFQAIGRRTLCSLGNESLPSQGRGPRAPHLLLLRHLPGQFRRGRDLFDEGEHAADRAALFALVDEMHFSGPFDDEAEEAAGFAADAAVHPEAVPLMLDGAPARIGQEGTHRTRRGDLGARARAGEAIALTDALLPRHGGDGRDDLVVLDFDCNLPHVGAQGADLGEAPLHLGHLARVEHREREVAVAVFLAHPRRRDAAGPLLAPADEHLAEGRMVEWLVGHERLVELEQFGESPVRVGSGVVGLVGLPVAPEFIREGGDAETFIGPVHFASVDHVEVGPDDHLAIAREHEGACILQLFEGADVRCGIVDVVGAGPAEDHAAAVVVTLVRGDVGPGEKEVAHGAAFRERERVFARAALDVVGLPVAGPVAVGVVSADAVFVDVAVAVVVDALGACGRPAARLFVGGDADHEARVLRIGLEAAERVAAVHLGDVPVAVEVVVAVFVVEAVIVVVGRQNAAAQVVRRGRLVEPHLASVGVLHGNEVEDALIDQFRQRLDAAVTLREIPDGVEHGLGGLDLIAVDVAVDEHCGLAQFRPRVCVVERDAPDVEPADALAQGLNAQQVGIRRDQPVQQVGRLLVVVEAVKSDLDFAGMLELRRCNLQRSNHAGPEHQRGRSPLHETDQPVSASRGEHDSTPV